MWPQRYSAGFLSFTKVPTTWCAVEFSAAARRQFRSAALDFRRVGWKNKESRLRELVPPRNTSSTNVWSLTLHSGYDVHARTLTVTRIQRACGRERIFRRETRCSEGTRMIKIANFAHARTKRLSYLFKHFLAVLWRMNPPCNDSIFRVYSYRELFYIVSVSRIFRLHNKLKHEAATLRALHLINLILFVPDIQLWKEWTNEKEYLYSDPR